MRDKQTKLNCVEKSLKLLHYCKKVLFVDSVIGLIVEYFLKKCNSRLEKSLN